MGAIGGGLYDSDFACDLRADIADLVRTPLSDDEIIEQIATIHRPKTGDHSDASDYWLVLADQLQRRGIHRPDIFHRAAAILERGEDIDALRDLDSPAAMLAKRQRANEKLLDRLKNPRSAKRRRPIASPQPLLFSAGETLAWPSDHGRIKSPFIFGYFEQDGWGFGIVSHAGHRFGVLPNYAVQILLWRSPDCPLAELAVRCRRSDHQFGEVSAADIETYGIVRLGHAPADAISPSLPEVPKRSRGIEWGFDAFNLRCANFLKFPHAPPSDSPLFPNEPDQLEVSGEVAKELYGRKRPANSSV